MSFHSEKLDAILEQIKLRREAGVPVAWNKTSVSHIVPDPNDPYTDLHYIFPEDQVQGEEVRQEGFAGKDAVLGKLKGYGIPEGQYLLELKTEAGDYQSEPASIRLIIDSNPPSIE